MTRTLCLCVWVCAVSVLMTQHRFKKTVCAYSCVCVCLCISTPLNTSRLTADLISRKQDLICVMISLRKISERTNWLSPLSLLPSWFFLFSSPFFLRSLSILSMRTVLCKSSDCVSKEKKEEHNVITDMLFASVILMARYQ